MDFYSQLTVTFKEDGVQAIDDPRSFYSQILERACDLARHYSPCLIATRPLGFDIYVRSCTKSELLRHLGLLLIEQWDAGRQFDVGHTGVLRPPKEARPVRRADLLPSLFGRVS